jgi:peptidoglycan hydrolase CwlO-like protein
MILSQISLPEINEWVVFIGGSMAFVAAILGFGYRIGLMNQSMNDKFQDQGKRIGDAEHCQAKLESSVSDLSRQHQKHEFQVLEFMKVIGSTEGKLERIKETLNKREEVKNREEREIADRLARIEERLNIFIQLHRSDDDARRKGA